MPPRQKKALQNTPKQSASIPASLQGIADSIIEAKLPNGLAIRLLPSKDVPTCSFYTFIRVGSRNEKPGITGLSHLFEHMMFNGAKKYGPGKFDQILESHGGTSNAYTSTDLTVYYEDFMAEALDTVVDLEADRLKSLQITPKMLNRERRVVMEERRLRVDNEIAGMLDEELSSLLWKAHPYRWPVIGWMKDLENIRREDCLQYFRTYYAPNNATIYIAGDLNPKRALQLIKKHYGTMKPGLKPPEVIDAEPAQKGTRRAEIRHPAHAPMLMMAWRGSPAKSEDTLVLDILQYALAMGQSSRLMKSLVFERELAVGVSIDWTWRFHPGAFVIALELKPGADAQASECAIYDELVKIAQESLTERELKKVKNNLSVHLLRAFATNSGRAHALGSYEMMLGHWREGLALANRYESITREDVRAVAERYLQPTRASIVTLVPNSEVRA